MNIRLVRTAAAAFAALAAASHVASAQEPPLGPGADGAAAAAAPAAEKDAVHAAWDALHAAQSEMRAALQARDMERAQAARTGVLAQQDAFKAAFIASDWQKIDGKVDSDLLGTGLQMMLNDALNARDGKRAVELCADFVAKLGATPGAAAVASRVLPMAYMIAGDVDKAVAIWEAGALSTDAGARADALLNLGDVRAAQGDVEGARNAWTQVMETPVQGPQDPAGRLKPYADTRLALVGAPAPEIDSKVWIDGEAQPLSALKGQVVIVDFWATWCPPCRGVMPSLDALYEERKKDGLMVLGVTHYYSNGFMPKAGTKQPVTDGEQLQNLPEATYQDHLQQFKTNLGISYPFVTATDADFKAYRIQGIPTMAVLDRAGKIAFVKVGGGDESMLRLAVDHLLAPEGAVK